MEFHTDTARRKQSPNHFRLAGCKPRTNSTSPLLIASSLALIIQAAGALRFTSVQMPALVQRGANFWLACHHELTSVGGPGSREGQSANGRRSAATTAGEDSLYSVKWYKNNEEFYRILFSGHAATGADISTPQDELQHGPGAQYFSQAGVNVLMSSSNATHVRLLNASLESEGVYACEISTENLSTIRHEREIKVYVLPHSKLNVIGLRSAYSLNERVELQCLADATRPVGALAWFINGRRITTADSRQFELLEAVARPATGVDGLFGDQLARASLGLKFKLTSELLRLATGESQHANSRRNQSRASGNGDELSAMLSSSSWVPSSALMRLECKFRLADVSDVTFNELKVSRASTADSSGDNTNSPEEVQYLGRRARRHNSVRAISGASTARLQATGRRHLTLTKSHGNQVTQSSCPARRLHFQPATGLVAPARADFACQLGHISLQPDDPIILETENTGDSEDEAENERSSSHDTPDHLELSEGATLSLNCSTLGALLETTLMSDESTSREQWPLGPTRRPVPTPTAFTIDDYCGDPMARRRALISGKHQTSTGNNERATPATMVASGGSRGQSRPGQQHQTAYVRLTSADGDAARDYVGRANSHASGDRATSAEAAQTSVPVGVTKSLAQLETRNRHQHQQYQQQQQQHHHHYQQAIPPELNERLRPPPLLEWFINNQEAPKSSASYEPDLPLTRVHSVEAFDRRSPGGAMRMTNSRGAREQPSPPLPSIDYAEYFANFQARPVDQHLLLKLKLEKKHFSTPDSTLTLRCTSTQAQLLATDSATVSFVIAPPDGKVPLKQHSGWQQRPVNTTASNQVRQKYLHQHPRSSSQSFASPPGYLEGERPVGTNLMMGKNSAASVLRSTPSMILELSYILLTISLLVNRQIF